MTDATGRLGSEQAFHDRQAFGRSGYFQNIDYLRFPDNDYLDHETWIRPGFDRLGPLTGARVLDFGCGHGMASVVLARSGAHVTAFDLSPNYLHEARQRAEANGVSVAFVQANGERLPFADGSFNAVWGNAVLHHLDLTRTARELRRILAPGGVGVFCEPWGENLLLNFARQRLPYYRKQRTRDETPLRRRDLTKLRGAFPDLEIEGFQFLSMVRRVLPRGRLVSALDWCDDRLLKRVPYLQQFCRYMVLTLRR